MMLGLKGGLKKGYLSFPLLSPGEFSFYGHFKMADICVFHYLKQPFTFSGLVNYRLVFKTKLCSIV